MSCTDRRTALWAYVDNELNRDERRELEAHLPQCEGCTAELSRLRALSARLDLLAVVPMIDFTGRVMAAVLQQTRRAPLLDLRWLWTVAISVTIAALVMTGTFATDLVNLADTSVAVAAEQVGPIAGFEDETGVADGAVDTAALGEDEAAASGQLLGRAVEAYAGAEFGPILALVLLLIAPALLLPAAIASWQAVGGGGRRDDTPGEVTTA